MRRFWDTLYSLFFFLFFRISSWLCSIPMWVTLILHFAVGLSIWWFWGTLAAWLLAGLIRYALIRFGRWGVRETRKELQGKLDEYPIRGGEGSIINR